MSQYRRVIFFALFFVSGFSGLIYQSIWSHYLKLFLGHAAYAQTLVLAIFMGGMAIGSLASGLFLNRWRSLLIGYAVVEGIIGVLAIVFHPVFTHVTDLTFTHFLSGMGQSPLAVVAIKWGIASLLIFPQSVLLGMTFPLMVGGILRHFPAKPGYTLSMLYFTNSFGAVFGVLASSFVLIGKVGLPGTMLTAGLINIGLAITVWMLVKNHVEAVPDASTSTACSSHVPAETASVLPNTLLLIAFLTGLSSFMYEIGWIRMLVLVLGGSTHSFELMLASFILGIALGGLWIRNRIDTFADSRVFLGYVQIAMGLAAVLSLWLYHYSFDWMSLLMDSIQRKPSTYNTFLVFSGVISMVIMLPATFFAGMTLPLITRLIMKTKKRENGIGYVYSANTLGAITGIFLSVHLIMPYLGLKNLIFIGASTDLVLGIYLLGFARVSRIVRPDFRSVAIGLSLVLFSLSLAVVSFDVSRLSSGVFRHGQVKHDYDTLFYEDGKTSTVTILESADRRRVIMNNGKPDASVVMDPDAPRSNDEPTQILIASYPLFQNTDAKTAAIIGMGSGMSTHAMLTSDTIEQVDTIEMEGKVFEGARYFMPFNERAYNDPRSSLHVEDAKTFFTSHGKHYDIIVSEPPNPWVSGVSTLFSQEFYSRIKRHLNPGGVFTQWIQLYEIDIGLLATVFNALDAEFEDYVVYRANKNDLILMASADRKLEPLSADAFESVALADLLETVQIKTIDDLKVNRVGSKQWLSPLFRRYTTQSNSDYFPILDNGAPKARFARLAATPISSLAIASIPTFKILENRELPAVGTVTDNANSAVMIEKAELVELIDDIAAIDAGQSVRTGEQSAKAALIHHLVTNCLSDAASVEDAILPLGHRVVALLTQEEQAPLWEYLEGSACILDADADSQIANWVAIFKATAERDYSRMSGMSSVLLNSEKYIGNPDALSYIISLGILGDVMQGSTEAAELRWEKWKSNFDGLVLDLPFVFLLANVGIRA